MGYERALSSLYLEESDRVSQVEFLQHTDFIAKVSGLDPLQRPEEARSKAIEKLDLDMIWFTHNPLEDFIRSSYSHVEARRDSWSRAYPTEWRKTFEVKSIEDILDFDPFEAWNIPSLGELAEHLEKVHEEFQKLYRHQLVPGGTYHTCLMWLIKMFGLEWTIKAAYMDTRGFEGLLERFGSLSRLEARAWAQTGIKVFISHDDICSTRGPFFPLSWMRRYLFPWYSRIWQELRSKGIKVLFCTDGDMTCLSDDIAKAGADGFIIEECCDLKELAEHYGNEKVIVGGVDVGILTYGSSEDVVAEVWRCLSEAGIYPGYFINVSGSIPDNVPLANLEAYFKAVKKYGLRSPMKPLIM
ncbi:MAG: uroporphyrinogen decarboxylase family protein [Candidatus Bathyarchaeia archaeon]